MERTRIEEPDDGLPIARHVVLHVLLLRLFPREGDGQLEDARRLERPELLNKEMEKGKSEGNENLKLLPFEKESFMCKDGAKSIDINNGERQREEEGLTSS